MSDKNDLPPWLQDDDDDQNQSPLSGSDDLPPWLQESGSASDADSGDDFGDISWESTTGGRDTEDTSLHGVTKDLPWRKGISDDSTHRSQEMSSFLDDEGGMTEREADAYANLSPIADAAEAQDADENALPDWLRVDTDSFAARSAEPAESYAYADETDSGYGRFEEASADDELDWMQEESPFRAGSDPYGGLTYDEWERQQEEAQREPEPQELTELPDWFQNIDQGEAADQVALDADSGTYMPEWFMGVEELSKDDAPDWLKDQPAPPPTPSSRQAAPPPPAAAEVPPPEFDDIFGDLPMPELEEPMDLGSLLLEDEDVAAEPPTTTPSQIRRVGAAAPASEEEDALDFDALFADDDAAPAAPVEMPAMDELDWLTEESAEPAQAVEPGFDDLFPAETPASQTELPAPDDLDWMSGVAAPPAEPAEAASPSWLTDYQEKRTTDEIETFRQTSETPALPAEPEGIADFGAWLEDIDLEAPPPVQEAPRSPAEAAAAGQGEEALEDFDLSALLGIGEDDLAIPAESALTGRARMELSSVDSLSFEEEEDLFKDFTPFEQAQPELASAPTAPGEILFAAQGEEALELAEAEDVPEWVRTITTTEDTVMLSVGGVTARFEQVPEVVLPTNLRSLREEAGEIISKKPLRGEPVKEGPLAGIEGALQLQPDVVKPSSAQIQPIATTTQLSDTQRTHLNALQRVLEIVEAETAAERIDITGLGESPDEAGIETAAPIRLRRIRPKRDRLLISLILFVAVLLPFLTDALHLADDPSNELDEEAAPLAASIDDLGAAEATPVNVLVAFEYAPTAAQELDPLVEAVLRDVLAHGGRPVIVSTDPIGLLNAERLMTELATDEALLAAMEREAPLQMPADYVLLPYLSGGPVGVRSLAGQAPFAVTYFARDYRGEDTQLNIESVTPQSFAFAIIAGERQDDARIWSEQFAQTGLPMFALVTAAAEPVTRTYVSAGVYDGMVAGLQGALTYDAARNTDQKAPYAAPESYDLPDPAISRWHSLTLGILLAAGVIAAGTLYNLATRLRRRRR